MDDTTRNVLIGVGVVGLVGLAWLLSQRRPPPPPPEKISAEITAFAIAP